MAIKAVSAVASGLYRWW